MGTEKLQGFNLDPVIIVYESFSFIMNIHAQNFIQIEYLGTYLFT